MKKQEKESIVKRETESETSLANHGEERRFRVTRQTRKASSSHSTLSQIHDKKLARKKLFFVYHKANKLKTKTTARIFLWLSGQEFLPANAGNMTSTLGLKRFHMP